MTRVVHIALRSVLVLTLLAGTLSACSFSSGSASEETGATANDLTVGGEPRGVVLDNPVPAPDFELTTHDGDQFRVSDHEGGVLGISFGYTGCPDVCPLTLSFMAQADEQLGERADEVSYLFITVDPERDDPERLGQYISRIDAPLTALTGEQADLEDVWADYDIAVERHEREDGNYLIDHSAQIWLVSPERELTMFLPMGSNGDDLANDIYWLLERSG